MPESPTPDPDELNTSEIKRSSRWRWPKRLVLSVSIALIVYFTWYYGNREWTKRQGERALAVARAEAERDDPDWTWERLNAARPRPPADKNSADTIRRVRDLQRATRTGPEQKAPDVTWRAPNVRVPNDAISSAELYLAWSNDALTVARSLKDRPTGFREVQLSPDVLMQAGSTGADTHAVAELLRWDAVIAANSNDADRLTTALRALLNASRSVGDDPFMISQLQRFSVRNFAAGSVERALAQVTAREPDLAALQTAWAADAEEPLLLYALRGERPLSDYLLQNSDASNPFKPHEIARARSVGLRWWGRAITAAKLPTHRQLEAIRALRAPSDEITERVSEVLFPSVQITAEGSVRGVAVARALVVGIACERFRIKNNRWPNDLSELVPAFLSAVPSDAFTGEPMRFAKSNTGVVIYSGSGTAGDAASWFAEPSPAPRMSARFRLWNPDQRRQAPPPAEQDPGADP